MSDLEVMWAAYLFSFGALGLYLVFLWLETQRLWRAETELGLARKKDGRKGEEGGETREG